MKQHNWSNKFTSSRMKISSVIYLDNADLLVWYIYTLSTSTPTHIVYLLSLLDVSVLISIYTIQKIINHDIG